MQKEFMLSCATIRKAKGHTASLFIMFLITALLLNAGFLVLINFSSYFDKMTEQLHTSDMYFLMPRAAYAGGVEAYLKNSGAVSKMQKENSIEADATIPYNGKNRDISLIFNNTDTSRGMSRWKFVGKHLSPDSMSAYVPYVLKADGGYKLNDKLKVTVKGTVLTFTIKGFTDDIFFSSFDCGDLSIFLSNETFDKVQKKLSNQNDIALVFANLSKTNINLDDGVKKTVEQKCHISSETAENTVASIKLPLIRMSRVFMASMISAMMVVFAAIIALVCLIVIRFRISNSIDDDMVKIGSLKAIGYSSRQIISSILLQFGMIAFAGSVVGILLSYLSIPALSNVFSHQSGLMWAQGFDAGLSGSVLFAILLIVLLVSLFTARRIRRIEPIVALRGGIVTHSFKKNYFPLEKTRGRLPFIFALKSIFQNKKSSIMIAVILVFVSFSSSFSVAMFYNSAIDTTNFAKTPGIEISNAEAYLGPSLDCAKTKKEVTNMPGVRKVQFIDESTVETGNTNVKIFIMDDYSKKETDTVYSGRYPRHDNEIAVGGTLAQTMHKKMGDMLTLKSGGHKADYLITGLTQGSTMAGMTAFITHSGMLKLSPSYKQQLLQVYLNKGYKSGDFLKKLTAKYGKAITGTIDMDKAFEQGMGAYTSMLAQVGIVTLIINILVVMLVLYLVINSAIIRRKREIGIQKAIGFTTFQLMNEISLGFLPSVITGAVIGVILGITQTNTVMSNVQRSMGIMKAFYIITPGLIILFNIAVVIFSYLISMFITFRIRKITAYSLVSE